MAKIVIDARRIRESTGRYGRELLRELQQLDSENEYHVLIHTKDQTHWTPSASNFYLHVVPYDSYTFGEQFGLARFIKKLKPDLVHFLMPQQPLLYFGKRVTTIHDLTLVRFQNLDKNRIIYTIEQTIFKFLIKNVARRSKVVITPTRFVRDDVAKYTGIQKDKILVTYESWVELTKTKTQAIESLRGKDYLFYVGNAFPHKNLDALVEAFKLLKAKHPTLHLVFAGKKEFFYKQLESKFQDLQDLHILGYVSDEQLTWLFRHAQAYVFPSLSEGFGLPGLEVMQHRTPLVSSNATCLPEVYGDAAEYFDPSSPKDIADTVHSVLKSKGKQQDLINKGTKRLEKFSWSRMAKKTHKAYLSVIEL